MGEVTIYPDTPERPITDGIVNIEPTCKGTIIGYVEDGVYKTRIERNNWSFEPLFDINDIPPNKIGYGIVKEVD